MLQLAWIWKRRQTFQVKSHSACRLACTYTRMPGDEMVAGQNIATIPRLALLYLK